MPWDLSEFERKRLEKGRKLLQESEEHRGCRDVKLYVESTDLRIQLHRIFLDDNGQRRRGLTAQEKLQGLIVFMRTVLCTMPIVLNRLRVETEGGNAITDAASELGDTSLCALMAEIAMRAFHSLKASCITMEDLFRAMKLSHVTSDPEFLALCAAFELHQRSLGLDPVMSAADVRLLALYSQQAAANELLRRLPEAPEVQQWLAAGLSANRQLLQLDPSVTPCLHCKRSNLMAISQRHSEAVAALRSALHEAPEHKSYAAETFASQQLATCIYTGKAGPRWNLEEVRGLLRAAKTALAKCKWMPQERHAHSKDIIADATHAVEEAAARRPRATMLPQADIGIVIHSKIVSSKCSGCGKQASSLKKCSSCHVAAYCSRACQVQHWKQGGHKQECAQLAASSSSGAGSSRG